MFSGKVLEKALEKREKSKKKTRATSEKLRRYAGFQVVEHTIQKSNPMFIFINGLFGCVFIRDKENEK